jgi:hypothetical protein
MFGVVGSALSFQELSVSVINVTVLVDAWLEAITSFTFAVA